MGVLPQVLEIIFEVQRKKSNEKIPKKKKGFPTYKTPFIYLSSLSPSCFQTSYLSYPLIHFKRFKVL
jgi:hypothetical protein